MPFSFPYSASTGSYNPAERRGQTRPAQLAGEPGHHHHHHHHHLIDENQISVAFPGYKVANGGTYTVVAHTSDLQTARPEVDRIPMVHARIHMLATYSFLSVPIHAKRTP